MGKELQRAKAEALKHEDLLSGQLRREADRGRRASEAQEALAIENAALSAEVQEAKEGLGEAVTRAQALEAALQQTQARVVDLTLHMSEAGAKEQAHLKERARLTRDLARLRFSAQGQTSGNPIQP